MYKNREVRLSYSLFRLFVYIYEQYRAVGQIEFDFAELSEFMSGDDCGKTFVCMPLTSTEPEYEVARINVITSPMQSEHDSR